MRKRLFIILLSVAILVGMFPTATFALGQSQTQKDHSMFSDMPNDWSTVALENAVKNGLMFGSGGKIMPSANLTRSEMVDILNRAFGATEIVSLSGYADNNITREEAFEILARVFKLSGASESSLNSFPDKSLVSEWAIDGTAALVEAGYVKGAYGKLNPKSNITRAECAQLMENLLKNYIVKSGTYTQNLSGSVMVNVPDVILENMTISGDLIIGDGVGNGDVTLNNVVVTGRTVIRGGGVNSIKIIGNSRLQNILIARVNGQVRFFSEDGIEVGEVIIDGSDDVIIEGNVGTLTILSDDIEVIATNAHISSATIEGKNSRIVVNKNSKIDNIAINVKGVNVSGLGEVGTVEANASDITVTTMGTRVTAAGDTSGVSAGSVSVSPGNSEIVSPAENKNDRDKEDHTRTSNASQSAPTGLVGVAPSAYGLSDGKITGTSALMEYRLLGDTDYTTATDTETTGLAAGMYNVRFAARTGFNVGPTIDVEVPAGPNASQDAPTGLVGVAPTAYGLSDGKIIGTSTLMEYRLLGSTDYIPATDTEITGLAAGIYNVRFAARAGFNAGTVINVDVQTGSNASQDAPTGLAGVAPSSYGLSDGKITGTSALMEYRLLGDTDYILATDTEITGLAAGIYNVRFAARAGFNAGTVINVNVPAGNNASQNAPTGLIGVAPSSYGLNDGKITGTSALMEYRLLGDTDYITATDTEITGLAAGIYNVRFAARAGFNAGTVINVEVPTGNNASQDAPTGLAGVAPSAYGLSDGKITGTSTLMEYRIVDAPTFTSASAIEVTGLVAGMYNVRFAARAGLNAGTVINVEVPPGPSASQDAPTGLAGVAPSSYGLSDGEITGTSTLMEYRLLGDPTYTAVTGTKITGLAAGTYNVRFAAREGFNAGSVINVSIPAGPNASQDAPTGLVGVAPSSYGLSDGEITGTSTLMEYRLLGDPTYTAVTGTKITGLAAGTYNVRFAAREGFNAGSVINVSIPAGPNASQNAPTGLVGVAPSSYGLSDGEITGTSTLMEYRLLGDPTYTAVTGTKITGLAAGTYNVRFAAREGFNAGSVINVSIPAGPNASQNAPTGLVGVAPSSYGLSDGEITGTSTLMEYRLLGDPTYTAVTGTKITGLAAGTYNVRFAAREGFNAGSVINVSIPAGPNASQDAPTGLVGVAPSSYGLSDGEITGTSTLMEYRLLGDPTYTAVTGTKITGLAAGTYNVRFAAREGFNAGSVINVSIPAGPNASQNAPTGLSTVTTTSVGSNDGKIMGTSILMEYRLLGDLTYTAVTGTEVTGLAAGIYNVRFAAREGFNAGTVINVHVQSGP